MTYPPFVLYDHGDTRRMVIPDPYYDEIADPLRVCRLLTFLALEHHVDAVAHIMTVDGPARLLGAEG